MHDNTARLMEIERKAMDKYHVCGCGFCEALAEVADEMGEDHPSNAAIRMAEHALADRGELARMMKPRCQKCWGDLPCPWRKKAIRPG